MSNPETGFQTETFLNPIDSSEYGKWVLFSLRMAFEKWQWMSPFERAQEGGRIEGSKSALRKPRSYDQEKFAQRKSEADRYLGVRAMLAVYDLDDNFLELGTLEYYDHNDGILALENTDGESTTIKFAEPLPVPDYLQPFQSYYGTKELVRSDLISIDKQKDWLLEYL